jgi:hypothetical protein
VSPTETLPARLLELRRRYIEELADLLAEVRDPQQRERISNRALQAFLADLAERAAREGEAACKLWEGIWQELAAGGADNPAYRQDAAVALRTSLRFIDVARRACQEMAAGGYPVSHDADLEAARAEVCDRLLEAETGWQPPGEVLDLPPDSLQKAKEEIARGGALDLDEVVRELQG